MTMSSSSTSARTTAGSSFTSMTRIGRAGYFSAKRCMSDSSPRQVGHQLAVKFTQTGLPRSAARSISSPATPSTFSSGARLPTATPGGGLGLGLGVGAGLGLAVGLGLGLPATGARVGRAGMIVSGWRPATTTASATRPTRRPARTPASRGDGSSAGVSPPSRPIRGTTPGPSGGGAATPSLLASGGRCPSCAAPPTASSPRSSRRGGAWSPPPGGSPPPNPRRGGGGGAPPPPAPGARGPAGPSEPPSPTPSASVEVAVTSRVVIPALKIDLPIVAQSYGPGQGSYPLCDVAQYLEIFKQPSQPGTTYIYAHAREGMFLPLLLQSQRDNGQAMIGDLVQVYTSDGHVYLYEIYRVKRHATDFSLAEDVPEGEQGLILQTSEGPRGTIPKLQIAAKLLNVAQASLAESNPTPYPRDCR